MKTITIATIAIGMFLSRAEAAEQSSGAHIVAFGGYEDCIRLENDATRVTLCPAAGGRVLEYSLGGKNALYLAPDEKDGQMTAGRFDIGPEQTVPPRPLLWKGRWSGKITGKFAARLVSAKDESTGVQLTRDFHLDKASPKLECTQTIKNVSTESKEYCHWSRTFALGGGICVIPLTRPSRFPNGYVMYGPGPAINFRPEDPNIHKRDGFLEITAAPRYPKLGMDAYAGWFAYLMKNDLMFVKRFPTYPDRVYNEVAGLTMSIWYPDGPMCELEPIGPRERLRPGQSASFTETWLLLEAKFPAPGQPIDLDRLAARVAAAEASRN